MNQSITLRDHGPGQPPGFIAGRVPVSAIMTREVVSVAPHEDAADAARILLEQNISGLPVIDAAGHPVGILSKTDLLAECLARSPGAPGVTVAELMKPLTFVLPQNESVSRAAALMAFEGVHRVPVVGVRGQVVGLVSALDVARWVARQDGFVIAAPDRPASMAALAEPEPE